MPSAIDAQRRSAVVLMIDGLSHRYLSPYGCTWVETPALDQLAAHSVTFERAIAETVDLPLATRSFLSGNHPLACRESEYGFPALDQCREAGVDCWLLTDDVALQSELQKGNSRLADNLDGVVALAVAGPEVGQLAASIEQTHLASCFAQLLQELPLRSPPFLFVVHLTSLSTIWDAPHALREKHRDAEDPDVADFVLPPNLTLDEKEFDPDEIYGFTCAYAAQLETLDTCLHVLMEELRGDGMLDEMLFCLGGLRGYPLGHNLQVGHQPNHLLSDATNVPLMIRHPDSSFAPGRSLQLVAPSQLLPYAAHWLTGNQNGAKAFDLFESEDCLVTVGESSRAISTPAWLLVDEAGEQQLFVKPDDRWDVNPVQDRCHWIVDELMQLLDRAEDQLAKNQPLSIGTLAEELIRRLG